MGSGVGVPDARRGYPGLVIDCEDITLLADMGPGNMRQLARAGFTYDDIDVIVITHFHPDHSLDLASFLFACKYPAHPRRRRLTVIGPSGLKRYYESLIGIFGDSIRPLDFEVDIIEKESGRIRLDGIEVTVSPVRHSDSAIGIRVKDERRGTKLAYSGDTDYCRQIVELARECDLAVLECSFPDEYKVDGHLTPSYAGRIAREAEVKKLVLTHIYPVLEERDILKGVSAVYGGRITVAKDLMKLHV